MRKEWKGGYTTHGKTKGIYNVHFKQVMLITLSSGDYNKSLKLHPTIELAHKKWVP
jgi:hypothetical protein